MHLCDNHYRVSISLPAVKDAPAGGGKIRQALGRVASNLTVARQSGGAIDRVVDIGGKGQAPWRKA